MADKVKVSFPQGKINVKTSDKNIISSGYFKYNKNYENKFNSNLNQVQAFIDNKVIMYLQEYVSWRTGTQAKSIRLGSKVGSGEVWIAVPYAEYQAYSKKIHKLKGKRGPRPFERMKADKLESIRNQTLAYSRRING